MRQILTRPARPKQTGMKLRGMKPTDMKLEDMKVAVVLSLTV